MGKSNFGTRFNISLRSFFLEPFVGLCFAVIWTAEVKAVTLPGESELPPISYRREISLHLSGH